MIVINDVKQTSIPVQDSSKYHLAGPVQEQDSNHAKDNSANLTGVQTHCFQ